MKKIFTLFAALMMAFSMFAADIPAGTKFYLTPSANWNQSNARFAVYFFGNGEAWVSMTKVAGENNLYEVTSPNKVYKNLIFCRMNPSAAANNWNNKWNQTSDLTYDGTKNHYTVKEGTWDKGGGTWSIWPVPAQKTYKDITITITANAEPQIKWWNAGDKLANGGYVAMTAIGAEKTYSYTLAQVDEATGVEYSIKVGEAEGAAQQTSVNVTADFKQMLAKVAVMGVNNWDGTDVMTAADDYLSASITLPLVENKSYQLKLTVDGAWFGGSSVKITKTNYSASFAEDTGGDGSITTSIAGDYVFTYTYATKMLVVTYPDNGGVTPPEPDPTFDYYVTGSFNEWANPDPNHGMTLDGDVYKATLTLAAGETQLKVTNGTWDNAKGFDAMGAEYEEVTREAKDGNILVTLATGKDVVVVYDATAGKVTFEGLTEKAPSPKFDYYVVGSFNDWKNPDANHGMTLVGDVYKATVTLNVGANMLKVTNGTWENAKGFDAMGAEYEEVSNDTKDGNILITLTEGKDVVVVYNATTGKVTFEGLTEKLPAVITYVLMGVNNDWTTGIPLVRNEENTEFEEYMLLGQEILDGDAVKVVTLTDGVATAWCGDVDVQSIELLGITFDENGNVVLAPGKYDFYYKVAENGIYIAGEAYPVEPEYDVMDITMTNLVVEEMEGFLVLTASDDENTGLNVMLALNQDGSLNTEVSYMALVQGWSETVLPIVEGTITNAYNEELATDVYTGLVVVEYGEGLLGLNLTMYAKPIVVTDVVVTDATITVETEDDGMGGTYENITVSANWNESVLVIEGVEKAHEGFIQIKEIFEVDGEEDWYIWMCMNGVITTVDNVLTVTGEFKNNWTGDVYNVTISGTLPGGTTTALDNIDATVAPVKAIVNGQLVITKDGVQYNAAGAQVK